MKHSLHFAITLLLQASLEASAADWTEGKRVFERRCAECHAPGVGHPGTQQLGWTRGDSRAILEQRSDLTAAYISVIVRNGLVEMPAFRPTEINDTQLRQLADYLARPRKADNPLPRPPKAD
jgi:mono/diheme cytochrome c family protein